VALVGWRLIPNRDTGLGADPLAELKPYIAELRVPEGSRLVDARLRDLEADAAKADVALIGVVRTGGGVSARDAISSSPRATSW
jgi:Trk K+ transport system NAD-binding subunit